MVVEQSVNDQRATPHAGKMCGPELLSMHIPGAPAVGGDASHPPRVGNRVRCHTDGFIVLPQRFREDGKRRDPSRPISPASFVPRPSEPPAKPPRFRLGASVLGAVAEEETDPAMPSDQRAFSASFSPYAAISSLYPDVWKVHTASSRAAMTSASSVGAAGAAVSPSAKCHEEKDLGENEQESAEFVRGDRAGPAPAVAPAPVSGGCVPGPSGGEEAAALIEKLSLSPSVPASAPDGGEGDGLVAEEDPTENNGLRLSQPSSGNEAAESRCEHADLFSQGGAESVSCLSAVSQTLEARASMPAGRTRAVTLDSFDAEFRAQAGRKTRADEFPVSPLLTFTLQNLRMQAEQRGPTEEDLTLPPFLSFDLPERALSSVPESEARANSIAVEGRVVQAGEGHAWARSGLGREEGGKEEGMIKSGGSLARLLVWKLAHRAAWELERARRAASGLTRSRHLGFQPRAAGAQRVSGLRRGFQAWAPTPGVSALARGGADRVSASGGSLKRAAVCHSLFLELKGTVYLTGGCGVASAHLWVCARAAAAGWARVALERRRRRGRGMMCVCCGGDCRVPLVGARGEVGPVRSSSDGDGTLTSSPGNLQRKGTVELGEGSGCERACGC
ncbi:hypothetical protein BESB_052710 [Besnoitia besnoiti]|uniref:Uncharacterized protein n=1 Tax=Besnoitia besnoiti TaxID=94643 RepID=A0A2A9MJP3_BESBE|nr:hypothetical protein BESB_052710 [Besnoitia besnoiti]PFH35620.1 hypothetical protein BESB_052710 [Besnoitia besnoiti]